MIKSLAIDDHNNSQCINTADHKHFASLQTAILSITGFLILMYTCTVTLSEILLMWVF